MSRKQILYWSYPTSYPMKDGVWYVTHAEMDTNESGYWFAFPIGVRNTSINRTIEAAELSSKVYGFVALFREPVYPNQRLAGEQASSRSNNSA